LTIGSYDWTDSSTGELISQESRIFFYNLIKPINLTKYSGSANESGNCMGD